MEHVEFAMDLQYITEDHRIVDFDFTDFVVVDNESTMILYESTNVRLISASLKWIGKLLYG